MPDMDSPKFSATILEDGASNKGAVKSLHISKRPREETSPVSGKRGRGENGDLLTVQVPQAPSLVAVGILCGDTTPSPPAPTLLESPSKLNRASPEYPVAAVGPFSSDGSPLRPAVQTKPHSPDASSGTTPGRRKAFPASPPVAARASVAATDPVFHAALLRLSCLREGDGRPDASPEALDWQWSGDSPERFSHWPRVLHPDVMDLLACVSASEERVVLTGCDLKDGLLDFDENPLSPHHHHFQHHFQQQQQQGQGQPQGQPRHQTSPWRAQRWRAHRQRSAAGPAGGAPGAPASPSPWAAAPATGAASSLASLSSPAGTPAPSSRAQCPFTPSSALRRPGGARRSVNRVRFSTHDMSVVDTPDPTRDGSEKSMVSALGGLQSILEAAERIRVAVASRGGASVDGGDASDSGRERGEASVSERARRRAREFEGYFDRFSSAGGSDGRGGDAAMVVEEPGAEEAGAVVTPDSNEEEQEGTGEGRAPSRSSPPEAREAGVAACPAQAEDPGSSESPDEARDDELVSDLEREARCVHDDVLQLVQVLHEMATSEAAPPELTVNGGWGPEHSSATAFYARELASLCGVPGPGSGLEAGGAGEASHASQLRVRYLDVLSCLVRYNLKVSRRSRDVMIQFRVFVCMPWRMYAVCPWSASVPVR